MPPDRGGGGAAVTTVAIVLAILPIVVLIGLGAILRTRGVLEEGFWPEAERLGYFVLLLGLFFHGLATADLRALPVAELAKALIL